MASLALFRGLSVPLVRLASGRFSHLSHAPGVYKRQQLLVGCRFLTQGLGRICRVAGLRFGPRPQPLVRRRLVPVGLQPRQVAAQDADVVLLDHRVEEKAESSGKRPS